MPPKIEHNIKMGTWPWPARDGARLALVWRWERREKGRSRGSEIMREGERMGKRW